MKNISVRKVIDKLGIVIALIALGIVFSIMTPSFLDWSNIINILRQTSINGILAAGMTFVILTGGIDLSVGAIVALAGVMGVYFSLHGWPTYLAVLGALIVGGLAGYINGFLTAKTKLPAIIVTLGSMSYLRGLAYIITGGYPLVLIDSLYKKIGTGLVGSIPVFVIITILVYVLSYLVLRYTVFGRNVYMIGGNEEASRLTGIKVVSRLTWVYTISGICAAIAGVILSAKLFSGQPNAGMGYELDAIAAVVLGGTSLTGGVGTVSGTLFGALFMGILSNDLSLNDVGDYPQQIIKGVVIIAAIFIDQLRKRKK